MFSKKKAKKELSEIFILSERTASIPTPVPTYFPEIRFELLFLFFFLYDYRKFFSYDKSYRIELINQFINQVSKEISGDDKKELISKLYNTRINSYHEIINTSAHTGEFLTKASEYVEILALFIREKNKLPNFSIDQISKLKKEISSEYIGKLARGIAISISANALDLW